MIATSPHTQSKDPWLDELGRTSKSLLMQDILYKILLVSKLDANIFIVGEIGSGKKRLAQLIHKNSSRADKPFHTFYCVDIDEHEYKNAFWGHLQFDEEHITLRYEALEKAIQGILYLDQFSEISPQLMHNIIDSYVKGCNQLFRFDKRAQPRLILSFNQESYHEILHNPVWKEMLEKLNPVVIMLPPLRERKEDIPLLINFFIDDLKNKNTGYNNLTISSQALCECLNYNWPGNIRQLKNAIFQGAILSYGQTIEARHLPFSMNWQLPYEFDGKRISK